MIQRLISSQWTLVALAIGAALSSTPARAQNALRPRRAAQSSDEPNALGETDAAAMNIVDSLFAPLAPVDPLPGVVASHTLGKRAPAQPEPKWSARLARNPKPADGNPPFVLVDRYGRVQRYVEPSASIDLNRYVGHTVAVRRDTGGTLLASQLELPRSAGRSIVAVAPKQGVRLAAQEVPVEAATPTPADGVSAGAPTPAPTAAEGGPTLAPVPMADSLPTPDEMIEGEVIDQGPMMPGEYQGYEGQIIGGDGMVVPDGADPLYLDGNSEFGACPLCGDAVCGGRGCVDGCGFGSRPVFYARGEYLHWWFDGMNTPPLVVRGEVDNNGTPTNAADDFFTNAVTVYGGNKILDRDRSGARIILGYFLDDYGRLGIEGDYITFGQINSHFQDGGNGVSPIVGRPFIDATTGLPTVEDVSFPGIAGTVTVDADSTFQSASVRLRRNLCCVAGASTTCGDCVSCGSSVGGCAMCGGSGVGPGCPMCPLLASALGKVIRGGTRHVDILYGVRWAQLDEGLHINENLEADDGTTFLIDDVFGTSNQFVGGDIGFAVDWQRRRWSMEFNSRLAIGSTRQRVFINGQTLRDDQLFPRNGILAQPSNDGVHERDEFSVLPEVGLTAGYQVTDRLRLTLGYTLLYWSRVVRPGDQIDTRVNPAWLDLPQDPADLPDPSTIQPQSPEFVFRDTDLWAHGINAGLDYRW